MSSQTYVSMSKVIPIVRILKQAMDDTNEEIDRFVCLQLLKDDLRAHLETRFVEVERSSIKVLSTYLDPRYCLQIKILLRKLTFFGYLDTRRSIFGLRVILARSY